MSVLCNLTEGGLNFLSKYLGRFGFGLLFCCLKEMTLSGIFRAEGLRRLAKQLDLKVTAQVGTNLNGIGQARCS